MKSHQYDYHHSPKVPPEVDIVESGTEPELYAEEQHDQTSTIVIKIGGSTLGSHDTTLDDLVTLMDQGTQPVVVHGGGREVSDWMERQGVRPRFVNGLRVTDGPVLDIAVAVLSGLINKSLVADLITKGGRAVGLSGVDGGILRAKVKDEELGNVGTVMNVCTDLISAVVGSGFIPVIAPIAMDVENDSNLLNVNADTVAGEIAVAIGADRLVVMTDVEGVMDSSRRLIPRLTARHASGLVRSNVVAGGMIPKIEACLKALEAVDSANIVDGRVPHSLTDTMEGKSIGTRVG